MSFPYTNMIIIYPIWALLSSDENHLFMRETVSFILKHIYLKGEYWSEVALCWRMELRAGSIYVRANLSAVFQYRPALLSPSILSICISTKLFICYKSTYLESLKYRFNVSLKLLEYFTNSFLWNSKFYRIKINSYKYLTRNSDHSQNSEFL
jgi:hypothetical protein